MKRERAEEQEERERAEESRKRARDEMWKMWSSSGKAGEDEARENKGSGSGAKDGAESCRIKQRSGGEECVLVP